MRTLLKLLVIAGIGLALAGRRTGGSDSDTPGGTNRNRGSSPPPPVGGFNSGRQATKASLDQGEAGGGASVYDSMGHDLDPDGNPIYRTPDGFKPTDDVDTDGAADFLPNGSGIFHGETYTRIGSDEQTINNVNHIAPMDGVHDIVVHGERDGLVSVDGNRVNPQQIATAVQNNPNYEGGPIRLLVCHSGASGVAQEIANSAGVPIYAPTDRVGTIRELGPGQTPIVDNNGTFDWYYPEN